MVNGLFNLTFILYLMRLKDTRFGKSFCFPCKVKSGKELKPPRLIQGFEMTQHI